MAHLAAVFFRQLAQSIRFADVLDVLLVAAFLYALLTWVRRDTRPGTSWRLAVVLVLFAAVYLLAGTFSMYLVEHLLGFLFVGFLVAAVVLFQSEIRRMIDRIGAFSLRTSAHASTRSEQVVDTITEAAGRMAEARMGALMAVRGRDAWEGVTQGGIALNGHLSLPLLESIFHDQTDGHDGAVLIEEDRAVRFAAHLPLAAEIPEASRAGGTRHAAALGLAEQCDAFVIVVSEERGTISVAERGELVELSAAGDLRERLGRFWDAHYGAGLEKEHWWGRKSVQTALLSVLMASLFWLTFAYEPGSVQRTLTLPVAFRNVKPTWLVGEPTPEKVDVTLTGSKRAFQLVETSDLNVTFPLAQLKEGTNELLVTEKQLDLPSGLSLQEARPQTVEVTAQRLHAVRLPVRVQHTGTLPRALLLQATPDSATLMVPRDARTGPESISTETVALDSLRTGGAALQTELLPPDGTRLPNGQRQRVQVRLDSVRGE